MKGKRGCTVLKPILATDTTMEQQYSQPNGSVELVCTACVQCALHLYCFDWSAKTMIATICGERAGKGHACDRLCNITKTHAILTREK